MKLIPKQYIAIKVDNEKPSDYPIAVCIREDYIVLSSKEIAIDE